MPLEKRFNPWKIGFIALCIFLLVSVVISYILLQQNLSNEFHQEPPSISEDADGAEFIINTRKEDINIWLKQELERESEMSEPSYHLFLDDFVYFQTKLQIFGFEIPLEMSLEPFVTGEGNLELQERNFSVGNFSLSSQRVFELIRATGDLPDWISVIPEEKKLFLNLRDGLTESVQVEMKKFNLLDDEIEILLRLR